MTRALLTSCAVGMLVVSCAQGSSEFGIGNGGGTIGGGGNANNGGATTGQGGTTSSSEVTTSSTAGGFTTSSTAGGFTTSSTTGGFTTSSTAGGFTTSSSTSTSSTSSTSGGPSSPCDVGGPSQTDCNNCGMCAQNSICFDQVLECEFDCNCSAILCCAANCSDNACVQDCVNLVGGSPAFDDLIQCLDCACVNTCGVPPGTCP